jgi:hypothetical protein
MQRKLKDKGSNYKEILEDTRKHLAQSYLKQVNLSLGLVAKSPKQPKALNRQSRCCYPSL